MDFGLTPDQSNLMITLLSALSVFSAVVVVVWPYLVRDVLNERMRQVATEREQLRRRGRRRVEREKAPPSLRREPKKLYRDIVKRLKLGERLSDGKIGGMLRMAGYRGNAATVTFLAVRVLVPVAMFATTLLYLIAVLRQPEPMVLKFVIALAGSGLGYFLPILYLKNRIEKRQQSIQRAWPDALDLMLICVESGMGIESALRKVAEEIGVQSVDLAEELMLTTAELSFLQDRRRAFDNLSERTGLESVKAVVASLKQAEKHGTSLGRSLRVLSQENRDTRLAMAEKKAAALPPKLTVPMILFFLPVLFAVIITPAAIKIGEMP